MSMVISVKDLRHELLYGNDTSLATYREDALMGSVARRCEDYSDQVSTWLEKRGIAHKVVQSAPINPEHPFEQTFITLTGSDLILDPTAYQYAPIEECICYVGTKDKLLNLARNYKSRDDWDKIWNEDWVIKDLSHLPVKIQSSALSTLHGNHSVVNTASSLQH